MEYIFQLSRYDQVDLEEELAKALEKLTELNSRERLPSMWKYIDRSKRSKTPDHVLKRRRLRYKIYGYVLMTMGIILFVPGLLEPRKLLLPLIFGALSLILGFIYVWPWEKRKRNRFEKLADKVLSSMENFEPSKQSPTLVHFKEKGMMFPDGTKIPYGDFERIIETKSIYLLICKGKSTMLQKCDLIDGSLGAYHEFLEQNTGLNIISI